MNERKTTLNLIAFLRDNDVTITHVKEGNIDRAVADYPVDRLMELIRRTDESTIYVVDNKTDVKDAILLVYGNDPTGSELICNYTTNSDRMEQLLDKFIMSHPANILPDFVK